MKALKIKNLNKEIINDETWKKLSRWLKFSHVSKNGLAAFFRLFQLKLSQRPDESKVNTVVLIEHFYFLCRSNQSDTMVANTVSKSCANNPSMTGGRGNTKKNYNYTLLPRNLKENVFLSFELWTKKFELVVVKITWLKKLLPAKPGMGPLSQKSHHNNFSRVTENSEKKKKGFQQDM